MTSARWLAPVFAMLALEWQLCGENPLVFCYRMGWSMLVPMVRRNAGACSSHP